MKRLLLLLPLLCSALSAVDNSFGTMGYLRLQTSLQDDKELICFKAPGAGSKYRLGNECETWMELGAYQDLGFEDGITLHNQVRPVFTAPNEEKIEFLRFDELYTELSGLFEQGGSLWIGRRYYQRHDSHITDYWPLNMSGDGFGLERLGLGKGYFLSYSFMRDELGPRTVPTRAKTLNQSHDLRIARVWERGETTLFLNYTHLAAETFAAGERIADQDGFAVGLVHKDTLLTQAWFGMEGENVTMIEYGTGSSRNAGNGTYESDGTVDTLLSGGRLDDAETFRFVNYNAFEKGSLGMMSSLTYEYRDSEAFDGVRQEWLSFGVRPYWFFHRNLRGVLEAGYDYVEDKVSGETYNLLKGTVALELAPKPGVWTRPVLRLYYTSADWSESARGLIGGSYYVDASSGDNVGIQVEYWW